MLSIRGLCDGPIPRAEESYRLWCVNVCDLENRQNEAAVMPVEEEEEEEGCWLCTLLQDTCIVPVF